MVVFLLTWLYIGFTFEVCPFFWDIIDNGIFDVPFFFYYSFFSLFFFNYFIISWKEFFNNNKDLIYRFFSLCWRPFSIFFALLFAHIKRFFHFLFFFDYRHFFKILKDFFKNLYSGISTIWRPLFRKWSYFGYFRANKSKWWKNK